MSHGLYQRPDLYDLIAPADPGMEAFYVGAALARGGRVLDLACGSGRFTIPLARAGLEVVAGDLSADMLDGARRAAVAAGVEVSFHQLDMRDFELPVAFDTIVVAANSVMHLLTHDDFQRFFAGVSRHLAPDGRLVFDVFVPSLALLSGQPNQRYSVATYGSGADRTTVEETIRYDPAAQISDIEWIWSRPGHPDFWRHPLTLRQIFPEEMRLLAGLGGLRLLERFGDFERSAFGPNSPRQVCICGV